MFGHYGWKESALNSIIAQLAHIWRLNDSLQALKLTSIIDTKWDKN